MSAESLLRNIKEMMVSTNGNTTSAGMSDSTGGGSVSSAAVDSTVVDGGGGGGGGSGSKTEINAAKSPLEEFFQPCTFSKYVVYEHNLLASMFCVTFIIFGVVYFLFGK